MKQFILARLVIVCLAGFGFGLNPSSVAAQVVFQEDFSQDLSRWESPRAHADWWLLQNGTVEATVPTPSTVIELIPKDEFWNSDWKNIEYELDYTPLEGVDKNISFGFENLQNWYEIHFVEEFYSFEKLVDGQVPFTISNPFLLKNGQMYHLKIRFLEGYIKIWVDSQLILDTFDHTFQNDFGKIGIKAGTGAVSPTKVRFDNIVVRLITEPAPVTLTAPHLKQTDPQWASDEYDSAHLWATTPTIGRWGCALTSMVMIMRAHGLQQMPDGQPLTPRSLNAWLKSQADGYVGDGALNWLAVTRLTRLISQVWGTPKLEYQIQTGASLATARSEIENHRPVILQLPNHFLVSDQIDQATQDLAIKDPAYQLALLSQHKTAILSTRMFTPSQTDLSYLLITHQPSWHVQVTDEAGQPLVTQTVQDSITEAGTRQPQRHAVQAYTTLAKPQLASYFLTFTSTLAQPLTAQIWIYDQSGTAKQLTINQTTAQKQVQYLVKLQPATLISMQPSPSPSPSLKPSASPKATSTRKPANLAKVCQHWARNFWQTWRQKWAHHHH